MYTQACLSWFIIKNIFIKNISVPSAKGLMAFFFYGNEYGIIIKNPYSYHKTADGKEVITCLFLQHIWYPILP